MYGWINTASPSLVPRPSAGGREGGTHCSHMRRIFLTFRSFRGTRVYFPCLNYRNVGKIFVCKCQVGRPGNEARASSVDPATQQIRFTNYIHTYIHTYMNQRVVAAKQVHINDTQNNTLFKEK